MVFELVVEREISERQGQRLRASTAWGCSVRPRWSSRMAIERSPPLRVGGLGRRRRGRSRGSARTCWAGPRVDVRGCRQADAACHGAARSATMSPKRLSATITSKRGGSLTMKMVVASTRRYSVATSGSGPDPRRRVPQAVRRYEHVVLVDQGQVSARSLAGPGERVADDPLDSEPVLTLTSVAISWGGPGADGAPVAGIQALGASRRQRSRSVRRDGGHASGCGAGESLAGRRLT